MKKENTQSSGNKYVPLWQKFTYGLSGTADNLMQNGINTVASQVMVISLGMNPILLSITIFIARIWDAFTDPLMGSISDNTRTRFGRRRPYMFWGGLLGGLVYMLLWQIPAGMSEMANFFWFLIGTLLFYSLFTVFSVPSQALGYELSPEYNERTRIMAFRSVFAASAGFAMHWQYKMTQLDCFDGTLDGIHTVSLYVGAIIIITTVIPAIFSRERLAKSVASTQAKIRFWDSAKVTMRNRDFRLLMGATIAACLGLFMVGQLGPFINIYYVCGGSEKEGATIMAVGGTVYALAGLLSAPVLDFVSRRIGKRKTMIIGLSMACVGALLKWVTFTPAMPYLQLLTLALMAPSLQALWMLTPSIVADICDEDELATGIRREGMYSAVHGYIMKIGVSIGLLMTGILLKATGFDAALGGDQLPGTILSLRLFYAIIPAAGLLVALILILRITMNSTRAKEVQRLLEERHAKTAAADIE